MRSISCFSARQLDETCNWLHLEGEYSLYEYRMYNLKLLIHSKSETCEVFPLAGYERNPVLEGRRSPETINMGFCREDEVYHKEAILEYLNKFFPQYIWVDVYVLTEDVCVRKSDYSSGEGSVTSPIRHKETNILTGISQRSVKFQCHKGSELHTWDIIYRKIVNTKKIDTIMRTEEEAKQSKVSLESFYIYEHYYYDEQQQKEIVFYVGKGTGDAKGSNARIYSEYRNKFWQEIVDSLNKKDVKWKYRVVGFFNSNKEALEFELKLQEDYWKKGQCLGCADLRRRHKYNEESVSIK